MLDGLEAARKLKAAGCQAKVVFLTMHGDLDYVRAAFAAGALGFVIKGRLASDLLPALREAQAGRSYVSPSLSR
jgi:DNA-binding NarL/FixJ family response regulator